jgi:5-methylcytosine-specific restriction endonuclease McrA
MIFNAVSSPQNPSFTIAPAHFRSSRNADVQPISESKFRISFTINENFKKKLEHARALLSHGVSPADLPALLEKALDVLIERAEYRRFGLKREQTDNRVRVGNHKKVQKRRVSESKHGLPSRYIPMGIRRRVWQRDGGVCTYVSPNGTRCSSTDYLQMDHVIPFALGGESSESNLRLRCFAHNAMHAEQTYGSECVAGAVMRKRAIREKVTDPKIWVKPRKTVVTANGK